MYGAEQWSGATWICTKPETLCSGSELWHLGILWMLTYESQRSHGGPPVSFLRRGERARRRTRGGWGERGTHKRGYWLVWREERGRLMMPSSHLAIMVDFLLFTFPFKKAFPAPWWKERLSVLWDTHVCVLGGSVGWGDWTVMPFWFTALCSFLTATNVRQMGKIVIINFKYIYF